MASDSFKVKKSLNIKPSAAPDLTEQGDVGYNSADEKLQYKEASATRSVVNEDGTATLTNKTIDADDNTLSNIEVDNLKSGVLDTDLTAVAGTDTTIPSAKATKAYADAVVATEAAARAAADTALQADLDAFEAQKGVANGLASLDSSGKLTASQVSAIAITDTYVVASQAAMLALTLAETGDIAVRTDLNKSFILKGASYSVLADWQELLTPTDAVQSVNGATGTVVLTSSAVVGISDSQTLTNKTISGSSNTLSNIARSSIASGTAYGAVVNDSSGNLTSIAPGTSGNVLKSDGTSWTSGTFTTANLAVTSKTANYTATGSDDVILCDATSGAFTITLPSAASNTGKVLRLKKTDSSTNAVTISGTVDGITSRALDSQYETLTTFSDGTNWRVQSLTNSERSVTRTTAYSQATPTKAQWYIPDTSFAITLTPGKYQISLEGFFEPIGTFTAPWSDLFHIRFGTSTSAGTGLVGSKYTVHSHCYSANQMTCMPTYFTTDTLTITATTTIYVNMMVSGWSGSNVFSSIRLRDSTTSGSGVDPKIIAVKVG